MIVDAGYDRLFVVRLNEKEYAWLESHHMEIDGGPRDTLGRLIYAAIQPKGRKKKKQKTKPYY